MTVELYPITHLFGRDDRSYELLNMAENHVALSAILFRFPIGTELRLLMNVCDVHCLDPAEKTSIFVPIAYLSDHLGNLLV